MRARTNATAVGAVPAGTPGKARHPNRVVVLLAFLATVASLGVGLAGQAHFHDQDFLNRIPLMWGAAGLFGGVVWVWAGRYVPAGAFTLPSRVVPRSLQRRRVVLALLGLSAAAAIVGLALLWGDFLSGPGVLLWLGSIVGLLAALGVGELSRRDFDYFRSRSRGDWLKFATAILVVAAGFALRLYRLDGIPANFGQDEAQTGDWGLSILHQTPVSGQHIAGAISPLQVLVGTPLGGWWLYAAVAQLAGETPWGLRLTSAIAGGLGIWLFYLLMRNYTGRWAALGATILLAVNHDHLFWSRSALLRAITALCATAVIYFVLRGLRNRRHLDFLLAGLFLGFGQYVYQSIRLLVLAVGLFFLYMAVRRRSFVRLWWRYVLVMALGFTIAYAPETFEFLRHPDELLGRNSAVYIFNIEGGAWIRNQYPGLSDPEIVIQQLRRTLVGIVALGDGSDAFYSLKGPLIDPLVGGLLLVGLAGVTLSWRRPERVLIALWLWVQILIMSGFTTDPPPVARFFDAWPALFAVVGFALDRLGRLSIRAGSWPLRTVLAAGLIGGIGYGAYWNYDTFFVRFPREQPPAHWTTVGRLIRGLGPSYKTYMIGQPNIYFFSETGRFWARYLAGDDLLPDKLPVAERGYRDGLFVVHAAQEAVIPRLQQLYPGGELKEYKNARGERLVWTYKVSQAALAAAAPPGSPWRQYDLRFGNSGTRFGEMRQPEGIRVDGVGRIYVADTGNRRVDVYDPTGRPLAAIAGRGSGDGALRSVSDLAVTPDGGVFVADRDARVIQHYDASGRWLGTIGDPSQLGSPGGVALAEDGSLLVTDAAQHQLLRYSAAGELLQRVGQRGSGPGQLDAPFGVAVAPDGVYVAESGNRRVQHFSARLDPLGSWPIKPVPGGPRIAASSDAVYLVDPEGGQVLRYSHEGLLEWAIGTKGDQFLQLLGPAGVATDAAGSVFLVDQTRHQIYRYDVNKRLD